MNLTASVTLWITVLLSTYYGSVDHYELDTLVGDVSDQRSLDERYHTSSVTLRLNVPARRKNEQREKLAEA